MHNRRDAADERYDAVVVGGGAAGLAGALALARSRRRVLVVDAGQPRNAPAGHVHNFLTREGMPPADLVAAGRAEIAAYGVEVVSGAVVAARRLVGELTDPDGGFVVTLDDGREARARRLLMATGAVDELPPIPGIAERWGQDVLHCPYCHGWEARDRAIGVLVTGPLAVHGALLWRQLSDDVVLFLHESAAPTGEQAERLAARGIRLVAGAVDSLDIRDDRLVGVRMRSGDLVPRDVLVVASRPVARVGALAGLGLEAVALEMDGQNVASRVPAAPTGASDVPGVWVAGNVADPMAQVIAAAAAGLLAGAQINADLVLADAAHAAGLLRAGSAAAANPIAA